MVGRDRRQRLGHAEAIVGAAAPSRQSATWAGSCSVRDGDAGRVQRGGVRRWRAGVAAGDLGSRRARQERGRRRARARGADDVDALPGCDRRAASGGLRGPARCRRHPCDGRRRSREGTLGDLLDPVVTSRSSAVTSMRSAASALARLLADRSPLPDVAPHVVSRRAPATATYVSPTGFVGRAACRPCDAGHGHRDIGSERDRERPRPWRARPAPTRRRGARAPRPARRASASLHVIGVGDDAAEVVAARPGHLGEDDGRRGRPCTTRRSPRSFPGRSPCLDARPGPGPRGGRPRRRRVRRPSQRRSVLPWRTCHVLASASLPMAPWSTPSTVTFAALAFPTGPDELRVHAERRGLPALEPDRPRLSARRPDPRA